MTKRPGDVPPWRLVLGVAGLLVGLLLIVLAWVASGLPVNRSVPPQAYDLLGASLVIGLVAIGWWAFGQRRPAVRGRRSWRVLTVVLVVAVSASTLVSLMIVRSSYRPWVTDLGAAYTACGPFGVLASHWDHQALARVRRAFPGYQTRIATRCRARNDGRYLVEVAVGPFTAKGLPTELVVDERVSDADRGDTGLVPYADPAEALADLPHLDAEPTLRRAMGGAPRRCVLGVGDGGFAPDAFITCVRQDPKAGAWRIPAAWPPAPYDRSCDPEARCLEVDLALPRPTHRSQAAGGGHRNLHTFAHTSSGDGP